MSHKGKRRVPHPQGAQLIMGRNTVRELLLRDPERITLLLVAGDAGSHGAEELVSRAISHRIPVEELRVAELTERCGSESHQSVAALVTPRAMPSLKEFLAREEERSTSLVVMLDSVQDPHNFGAILRASECFGVDAVIWSKNRGSGLTPAVSKSSVGASELLTLVEVSNLAEAAGRLKDAGYWIVGAEVRDGASDIASFEFPSKMVLVVGSEGEGLHALLRKALDYKVYIPLSGQIDSLNVSQATAVLLYAASRARAKS